MIFDSIKNAKQYAGLNLDVDRILEEMQKFTPDNYPGGRIEVDGSRIFMLLNQYDTRAVEGASSEAHRKYIDVMYMIEGEELIYVKDTAELKNVTMPYDADKECLLADTDADATPIHMTPGRFVVLFPQDAHTPNCRVDGAMNVKKIVGKVRIAD